RLANSLVAALRISSRESWARDSAASARVSVPVILRLTDDKLAATSSKRFERQKSDYQPLLIMMRISATSCLPPLSPPQPPPNPAVNKDSNPADSKVKRVKQAVNFPVTNLVEALTQTSRGESFFRRLPTTLWLQSTT